MPSTYKKLIYFYRRYQIIISFVVLILLASTAILYYQSLPRSLSAAEQMQEQERQVASMIKTGDLEKCIGAEGLEIEGLNYKTVCQNNIAYKQAVEKLDVTYCDSLDNILMSINDCKQQVVLLKLAKEKSLSVCDALSDQSLLVQCQDAYWSTRAYETKDVALCVRLHDANARNSCRQDILLEQLTKSPSTFLCTEFSSSLQSDCSLFKKAAKDPSVCFSIKDRSLQGACTGTFSNIKNE